MTLDGASKNKSEIYFVVQEWSVPVLRAEQTRWRILSFHFNNRSDGLKLILYVQPGPQATRQRLFDMAVAKRPPFRLTGTKLFDQWNRIYVQTFLEQRSYKDATEEELTEEIRKHWRQFAENTLPQIIEAVRAEAWIWEQPN